MPLLNFLTEEFFSCVKNCCAAMTKNIKSEKKNIFNLFFSDGENFNLCETFSKLLSSFR